VYRSQRYTRKKSPITTNTLLLQFIKRPLTTRFNESVLVVIGDVSDLCSNFKFIEHGKSFFFLI